MGVDEAHGGLLPGEKVAFVQALVRAGDRVLMVGDGTNDAPALSSATVGIALASGGGGITAEAADAVLLADDPARIAEAIAISRRTLRLARQSIWVGLGLSAAAMVVASFGYLPPTAGALLQEGIDVAVILNALRATLDGDAPAGRPPSDLLAACGPRFSGRRSPWHGARSHLTRGHEQGRGPCVLHGPTSFSVTSEVADARDSAVLISGRRRSAPEPPAARSAALDSDDTRAPAWPTHGPACPQRCRAPADGGRRARGWRAR